MKTNTSRSKRYAKPGQFLAIMDLSGSGKSTLLDALASNEWYLFKILFDPITLIVYLRPYYVICKYYHKHLMLADVFMGLKFVEIHISIINCIIQLPLIISF